MADEAPLTISVGPHQLQGRYQDGAGERAAAICHPHPRYGGTMDNNVVICARDTLAGAGFATLRFNFRGVGGSTGQHADGVGEAADLGPVMAALAERSGAEVHLAAYSFGAWVALRAVTDAVVTPASVMLLSPPVDFMPFDDLRLPGCPCLIVVGDTDEFCGLGSLESWLATQETARLTQHVLPGVDHFYWGGEADLERALAGFIPIARDGR